MFQEISVDVKLTAKFETLEVYLREFQTDANYLVPPRYDFVKSLPLPTDARRSYIGPPIRTELVVSRDGTRSLELQVQTPEPGYKFEVIAVEPTDQVTRVKLRLTAPLPNDAAARSTTEYAKVTLGKAVTARIEVLVSTTRAGTATKVDEFGLVDVVKVR